MKTFKQYITEELLLETPVPTQFYEWLNDNPNPTQRELDIAFITLFFGPLWEWIVSHWDEYTEKEQQEFWDMYRELFGRPEVNPPMNHPTEPTSPIDHQYIGDGGGTQA